MSNYPPVDTRKDLDENMSQNPRYQRLLEDIEGKTYKAVNTPNEFSSAMQYPDTYQVLKTKRKNKTFFDLFYARLIHMLSPRPVIGNFIALGLAAIAVYIVTNKIDIKFVHEHSHLFINGILIAAAFNVIKSASRSILLPLAAMIGGYFISSSLGAHEALWTFNKTFYEYVMMVGVLGTVISIFNID